MNKLLTYILLPLAILLLTACQGEDEDAVTAPNAPLQESEYRTHPGRRTIIAYITGDNNISSSLANDIREMVAGSSSLPSDCRLLVLADVNGQKPYIAHIRNNALVKVKEYTNDFYTTSPDSMRSVFQWIIDNYPSAEYAAVLGGHGSGPLIRTDTVASNPIKLYAYGYDAAGEVSATSVPTWMNIPSIAAALGSLKDCDGNKIKMAYLFFDCCCCQSVEVAYELRNVAEYIIAPVSETPVNGADYEEMLPALCLDKGSGAEAVVHTSTKDNALCISGVRTEGLEALLEATKSTLKKLYKGTDRLELNTDHCTHYYKGSEPGTTRTPALHDMKHIMKINLSAEDYSVWLPYLENVVITKRLATRWKSDLDINFYLFQDFLTDEYYGGLSMIAPSSAYDEHHSAINTTMFQLQWCNAVGWHEWGW